MSQLCRPANSLPPLTMVKVISSATLFMVADSQALLILRRDLTECKEIWVGRLTGVKDKLRLLYIFFVC